MNKDWVFGRIMVFWLLGAALSGFLVPSPELQAACGDVSGAPGFCITCSFGGGCEGSDVCNEEMCYRWETATVTPISFCSAWWAACLFSGCWGGGCV
jgi:hypothetical protein